MPKLMVVLICMCSLVISPLALSEIPKEVQRDKYMLALSKALKSEDYSKSLLYINKLDALNIKLPTSMDYFRGEAYFHTGDQKKAITALNKYVSQAGSKGRYYKQALEILVTAEDTQEKHEAGRQKREYDEIINSIDGKYFQIITSGKDGAIVRRETIDVGSNNDLCRINYRVRNSENFEGKRVFFLDSYRFDKSNYIVAVGSTRDQSYERYKYKHELTLGNRLFYFDVWFELDLSNGVRPARNFRRKLESYVYTYCKV